MHNQGDKISPGIKRQGMGTLKNLKTRPAEDLILIDFGNLHFIRLERVFDADDMAPLWRDQADGPQGNPDAFPIRFEVHGDRRFFDADGVSAGGGGQIPHKDPLGVIDKDLLFAG